LAGSIQYLTSWSQRVPVSMLNLVSRADQTLYG
jgi:hypothetical protein